MSARDNQGRTALHYAGITGNTSAVSYLLSSRCRGRFTAKDCRRSHTSVSHSTVHTLHQSGAAADNSKLRDLLAQHVYYDTLTGEEIGRTAPLAGKSFPSIHFRWVYFSFGGGTLFCVHCVCGCVCRGVVEE